MSGWETTVRTGNPQTDQQALEFYRSQATREGLRLEVNPLPGGGFQVRAVAGGAGAPAQEPNSDFDESSSTVVVDEGMNMLGALAAAAPSPPRGPSPAQFAQTLQPQFAPPAQPQRAPPAQPQFAPPAKPGLGQFSQTLQGQPPPKPAPPPRAPSPPAASPPASSNKNDFDESGATVVLSEGANPLANFGMPSPAPSAAAPAFGAKGPPVPVRTPGVAGPTPRFGLPAVPAATAPSPGGTSDFDENQATVMVSEAEAHGMLPKGAPPPAQHPGGTGTMAMGMVSPGMVPGMMPMQGAPGMMPMQGAPGMMMPMQGAPMAAPPQRRSLGLLLGLLGVGVVLGSVLVALMLHK